MGQGSSTPEKHEPTATATTTTGTPPSTSLQHKVGIKTGKPICCCCPETKLARDECMVQNGEDACSKLIEAHKECLRAEGFNVQ